MKTKFYPTDGAEFIAMVRSSKKIVDADRPTVRIAAMYERWAIRDAAAAAAAAERSAAARIAIDAHNQHCRRMAGAILLFGALPSAIGVAYFGLKLLGA